MRIPLLVALVLILQVVFGQLQTPNVQEISINHDDDFKGFELIEVEGIQLFALGEHWHNIKSVPQAY